MPTTRWSGRPVDTQAIEVIHTFNFKSLTREVTGVIARDVTRSTVTSFLTAVLLRD